MNASSAPVSWTVTLFSLPSLSGAICADPSGRGLISSPFRKTRNFATLCFSPLPFMTSRVQHPSGTFLRAKVLVSPAALRAAQLASGAQTENLDECEAVGREVEIEVDGAKCEQLV